jgi:serine/threonine-protein kinase
MSLHDTNAAGLAANVDTEVGKAVVDLGLATRTEVEFCREYQKQSSDPNQRSLADLLIEHNFITVNQAKRIRSALEERKNSQLPGYQLISKLGKGAMATVYKARQVSLDRIVAVKVLPRKMSENQEFVDRFYKEGKAAARLAHNNIVQAIDVGYSPEGYHYFVMEYVEGKTLYDIMQPPPVGEGRHFSELEALEIGIQMADALAHAHQRNLIHRDVKPKNILLTPGGVAKLTDLGLARATDDKAAAESEAGKAYGTPYYISPEQIRGDVDIDFRADIYSLGATLYHMVTGRPPFEGDTPSAVMHKHLKAQLVPADHVNTSLSAGIAEVIEVSMAKRREERYARTEDMLEDLRHLQRGEPPVHARRAVNLESLNELEKKGKTVDLEPTPVAGRPSLWGQTPFLLILGGLGLSVLINIVLLILVTIGGSSSSKASTSSPQAVKPGGVSPAPATTKESEAETREPSAEPAPTPAMPPGAASPAPSAVLPSETHPAPVESKPEMQAQAPADARPTEASATPEAHPAPEAPAPAPAPEPPAPAVAGPRTDMDPVPSDYATAKEGAIPDDNAPKKGKKKNTPKKKTPAKKTTPTG